MNNPTINSYGVETIYRQLEKALNVKLEPVPDEWDWLYDVDFYIKLNEKYIGIHIKMVRNGMPLSENIQEKTIHLENQLKFTEVYGGKYLMSFQKL
ncbi:MAG: MjaI family restriction endonuclease [Ignavibacteriaceae bacterium]|nr:MjaI family restriction endonuclease [Ignavibacteriaceae bacterium]